ncbi:MAG: glycosyltransferase [Pseudomonadota bacterium]
MSSQPDPDRFVNIVHLELGRFLYGGAEQVRYLLRGMRSDAHTHTLLCCQGSELAAWAQDVGQPYIALPYSGEHNLAFVLRLARQLSALNADLLHVHSRRGADWMGPLAAWRAGVACVLSRRVDNAPPRILSWLMASRYRRTIAISHTIADVLTQRGVDPERLLTIHSAVNLRRGDQQRAREQLAEVLPGAGTAPVIAVIAQLIERKGHRFLLATMPALLRKHPDLKVVFFGRGPLLDELQRHVAAEGLAPYVVFAGFHHDLDEMLPALTLVVHPALKEGLGVSLLKAAASEIPVVGFNAGGVSEVVVNEHTGLLVPPEDVIGLTAAVVRLLDDASLRAQFGENARERVLREFSVDRMVQRHAALYDVLAQEIA